ncbi:putative CH-like domain in sperm protein [Plasmopara halstedii]
MTALLLQWLNDELKLHKRVDVIEKDASNGYLIAEVLHLHGLEPQLKKYRNFSTTAAKNHNMELLGENLDAHDFPFPIDTQRAIMMEDRSAVLQFFLRLKKFINQRSACSPINQKVKVKALRPSTGDTQKATNEDFSLRDLDERFLKETANKYHPTKICFYKGVDMAIHLRKFQKTQWRAENEWHNLQEKTRVDKSAALAAEYAAARVHMREVADYRRDLDREHQAKWKESRHHFLAVERDNLRLEMTLEARSQLLEKKKLIESEQDSIQGILDFERNMDRLGISFGGTDESLRAITVSDAGAVAHFRGLEKRVENLDFRPSNNLEMMKELRKRRREQLVAEKDQRMRQSKALLDKKKLTGIDYFEQLLCETNSDQDNADIRFKSKIEIPGADNHMMNPRERYLEVKRAELEVNYVRLRESGSTKREDDMKVLLELRDTKRKKERLRAWNVCADVVDDLVLLAIDIVLPGETFAIDNLKKEQKYLRTSSTPFDQGGVEMLYDLEEAIRSFLSCSGVWTPLLLESKLSTYDIDSDVQSVIEIWPSPMTDLNTSWHCPLSFILLSIFTEDDSGFELAKRISMEHHVFFLQFESLVDECVKSSYDPQKFGDQISSLGERERELGAFGPKILAFQQKNTPLPDTLAVEIMAKAVSLCRQQASLQDTSKLQQNGCMLHNFPRTLVEAKLLEKALLAILLTNEGDLTNAAVLKTLTPGSNLSDDTTIPASVSPWNCVISISPDPVPVVEPADDDITVEGSASLSGLVDKSTSSSITSIETQRKLALDEENRIRFQEQQAKLELFWSETTRHIQIRRVELHRDVVAELIHLCIDIYAQASHLPTSERIVCAVDFLPQLVKEARLKRRESMDLIDRLVWSKASKEIEIDSDAFLYLSEGLQKLKESLYKKLREPMATIQSAIENISRQVVSTTQTLEKKISNETRSYQNLVDKASKDLKACTGLSKQKIREQILTKLEVALGDIADVSRVIGNEFVHTFAQDPSPDIFRAVDIVYHSLPLICHLLKDFFQQIMQILRTQLYDRIPFLGASPDKSGHFVVLAEKVMQDAMAAAINLGGKNADCDEVGKKVMTFLTEVASEVHLVNETTASQYTLSEANVATQEITKMLQHVTLLFRFAEYLNQRVQQLYAVHVQCLQQVVELDIHTKDEAIAEAMASMRMHGHAVWNIQSSNFLSSPGIASCLPHAQVRNFITLAQLHALASACIEWEHSNAIVSQFFIGSNIANDEFIKLVLEVAKKEAFPMRWRDVDIIAATAVTVQQSTTHKAVPWRKFVWSLLCIQFTNLPSTEDILTYLKRALDLPAVIHQHRVDADSIKPCSILISRADFGQIPLWFEDSVNSDDVARLKELVFHMFSSVSCKDDTDTADNVALLPMLLFWCNYPSCSFSVSYELEVFVPHYPRGLFRVFHVLQQFSSTSQSTSLLSDVFGALKSPPSLESFTTFLHDCPTDWHSLYLLQNPFTALLQL